MDDHFHQKSMHVRLIFRLFAAATAWPTWRMQELTHDTDCAAVISGECWTICAWERRGTSVVSCREWSRDLSERPC
jgi:hypothetical protein